MSNEATWQANFRDLNAAVVRMATLSPAGRISLETANAEIQRLRSLWQMPQEMKATTNSNKNHILERFLTDEQIEELDRFDRIQLTDVLDVCLKARSRSEAGRTLFAVSRTKKKNQNDADRIRKYLARFGIDWDSLQSVMSDE